jgi:hypothetical protein
MIGVNRIELIEEKGLPVLLQIMKQFPNTYEIVYRGLCMLLSLLEEGPSTGINLR